jgi:hypothetical protein
MSLRGLERQIGRIEEAAACEYCAASDAHIRRELELRRSLGMPTPDPAAPTMRLREMCCGRFRNYPAQGFTPAEVADFARWDEMYWRGEVCRPEYVEFNDRLRDAVERVIAAEYGEHLATLERIREDFRAEIGCVTQAPLPYLCRVPGCGCDLSKTLDQWRREAKAKGFRVAA